MQGLGLHFVGVFWHGSAEHMLMNAALLGVGGWMAEPRLGPVRFAALALVCTLTGSLAEFFLVGPGFIGLSALAYGVLCHGLLATAPAGQRPTTLMMIALALLAEWVLLRTEVAVVSHLTAALIGGSTAMFANLFGPKGPHLEQMEWKHTARVVEIIAQTDEDDAEEAENGFLKGDFEDMFVLVDRKEVLGVIGFSMDEQVPDLAWLSWTYLDKAHLGKGLGSQMLNDLLGRLNQMGVRKIFIETSDYEDFSKKIYAAAHRLYEEFGAELELTVPAYHDRDEAKLIYGLKNPELSDPPSPEPAGATGLLITGLQKAPETRDVGGLAWNEAPSGVSGLTDQLNIARQKQYRMAVLPVPSDISDANATTLEAQGMRRVGRLSDYYTTDLHQDWWVCDLNLN